MCPPLYGYKRDPDNLRKWIIADEPISERKKKLLIYDPSCHDYSVGKPVWAELEPGHFVLGNQKELEGYRGRL